MAAPKNNQFWKLRSKHGRDAIFTDPQKLLQAAEEYFQTTSEMTWAKEDFIRGGDFAGNKVQLHTSIPFTLSGLCIFLHVNTIYFNNFKESATYKNNKDFSKVITYIENVIFTQKFNGASVGAYNSNIIARDLGLVEKKDLTTKGNEITNKELQVKVNVCDYTKKPKKKK